MRLGAFTGPAERVYRYGFPAPGRAEVAFEDGRRFHDLDLSHGRWSVAHSCRDDLNPCHSTRSSQVRVRT